MFVIAGVTGHVGSVVAQALLAKKERVKVLVRDRKKGQAWSKKGAEVVIASLDDEGAITSALHGSKGFFVLLPPRYDAPDFYRYQRELGDTVARAVRAAKVPHVVLLSSIGADVGEGNGPIKGLYHFENALRATGTHVSAIRATTFMENAQMLIGPAQKAGIFPSFSPSPDYAAPRVATHDIGELAAELLLHPASKSEVIDLLGPASSDRELADKLGHRLHKTLNVMTIPPAGRVEAIKQSGVPEQLAEIFAEMYAGFGSGRLTPKGDRVVQGKTSLDEVLTDLVPNA
jgi:uncharacterized protein YbjT (DUF2867 family)